MEELLHHAEQLERNWDWFEAAKSYKKAANLVPQDDCSKIGIIHEKSGHAFYHFAFQAENSSDFRKTMPRSVEEYGKAKEFYRKMHECGRTAKILRCDAMIAFASYWLASRTAEKKRLLDECWKLTREALKNLDETGGALEYGETYNQLSSCADDRYGFESSFQSREELIREALRYGERAIVLLSSTNSSYELARAYVKTGMYLSVFAWYFASDMDEKEGYYKKGLSYWQKAVELSEETAFLELLSMSGEGLDWRTDEMVVQYGKALDFARKTRDKYVIGTALDWLAYAEAHVAVTSDEGLHARRLLEKALEYAEEAMHQFSPISYVSPRGAFFWTGVPYAEYYGRMAFWETDPNRKRDFLKKTMSYAATAVEQADIAGYPDIIMHARYVLGSSLISLAKIETNSEEKRRLLESAVECMKKEMRLREQLERFNYLNLGNMWQKLASLRAELSQLEKDDEKRRNVLEEAISYQEQGLQTCMKQISHEEKKGRISNFGFVGWGQYIYGEMLVRLCALTRDSEHQRKALKAFTDSAEAFQKLNLATRVAESYWRVARGYDALNEHLKAAENFDLAADNYRRAAEKIPQLKGFYHDHAGYMQAWAEIEIARDHHERQEYDLAKEHFKKTASMHRSLIHWRYLAPNYSAWAQLEEAEELSRKEQTEKAVKAFEKAAALFIESKKSLQAQLEKIEDSDEKQMAANLANAADTRREYAVARIGVEEARILDKRGDHYRSSEKYGSAAENFANISKTLESEREQREFRLIVDLSKAWQKMTLAEAEASPALYVEASELFEEAKEYSPNEKTKMLLLGHSRFCKALKAGTEFADSRNTNMYVDAVRHLESATSYYVKAGFPRAAEYLEATKLLFDAYVHTENAGRASDPEKRIRLYAMAEKVLKTSAGFFMKAEHPEKREQVLGLLEIVRKEQEIAESLMEVLHAPSIVSATTSFTTPAPTREQAIGSERFEHADVQANLIVQQEDLKVGEDLEIKLEIVNSGKSPALLTKITEIIPKDFELVKEPETCQAEDSYLDLKGKRLDPLKTKEVKLTLKPNVAGVFPLKPVILYLDESGKYRSHKPEPVAITVKEPEIESRALEVSEIPSNRVVTGHKVLDRLSLGGLPQNYGVILTSPSCDERDKLVKAFLETGIENGEPTFYVTTNPSGVEKLTDQPNFHAFICNPQADAIIKSQPNVFKLKGVENLTEISIALASAIHKLEATQKQPARICIGIISDVLLQHHAVQTRRWLIALITELKSTGFTTLATINPQMHPQQELQAILDLFEGEISIYEKGSKKHLRIRKMSGQKYLEEEVSLRE